MRARAQDSEQTRGGYRTLKAGRANLLRDVANSKTRVRRDRHQPRSDAGSDPVRFSGQSSLRLLLLCCAFLPCWDRRGWLTHKSRRGNERTGTRKPNRNDGERSTKKTMPAAAAVVQAHQEQAEEEDRHPHQVRSIQETPTTPLERARWTRTRNRSCRA